MITLRTNPSHVRYLSAPPADRHTRARHATAPLYARLSAPQPARGPQSRQTPCGALTEAYSEPPHGSGLLSGRLVRVQT